MIFVGAQKPLWVPISAIVGAREPTKVYKLTPMVSPTYLMHFFNTYHDKLIEIYVF